MTLFPQTGFIRGVRHFLAFALFAFGTSAFAIALGTLFYMRAYQDPSPLPHAQAIVVLSGPGAQAPVPVGDTRQRVERGVALWQAGLAPVIVMSGAGSNSFTTDQPDSNGMAELARRLGVPADAIREEARSYSTLQNAWFTVELPMVDPAAPVIVVSNRYHLPRAWASFRWAGFTDIVLVAADTGSLAVDVNVLTEGVKWPLNLARAAGASLALAAGVPQATVIGWLE